LRSYGAGYRNDWQQLIPPDHWTFFENTRRWFEIRNASCSCRLVLNSTWPINLTTSSFGNVRHSFKTEDCCVRAYSSDQDCLRRRSCVSLTLASIGWLADLS
jgi:hypothetical protein